MEAVVGVDTAVEATVLNAAAAEVPAIVVLASCLATEVFCLLGEEIAAAGLCVETAVAKVFCWGGRGPEVEDTTGDEDVLLVVVPCPAAANGVPEVVVITGLEVDDTVVVVAASLLIPGVPWVDTTVIFCEGDAEDDTNCAVLAPFTGDAPAICTTVGVPNVVPCCTWSPVATC